MKRDTYMVRYWCYRGDQMSFIGRKIAECQYEETNEKGYPTGVKYLIPDEDIITVSRRSQYS